MIAPPPTALRVAAGLWAVAAVPGLVAVLLAARLDEATRDPIAGPLLLAVLVVLWAVRVPLAILFLRRGGNVLRILLTVVGLLATLTHDPYSLVTTRGAPLVVALVAVDVVLVAAAVVATYLPPVNAHVRRVAAPPPGATPWVAAPGWRPTNVMAVLALVFAFVFAPLGVVFGFVARSQIRRSGEAGGGLALAGIVVGAAYLLLMAGMFAFVLLQTPAV